MSITASSELMSLCRSQLSLLQSWGAAYSTIYLAQEVAGDVKTHFVPLLVYPDISNAAIDPSLGILPAEGIVGTSEEFEIDSINQDGFEAIEVDRDASLVPNRLLKLPYEIFLPLIHEQLAIGLLVTARQDRSWNRQERQQIEKMAQTLAIACVMEKQQRWLKDRIIQQQKLQSQQRDLLNNLLHQIRSPLTAIRTFGKLLLKRLLPENRDREIATGIVQQSDRLTELLAQIDASLDLSVEQALILESQTPVDPNDKIVQSSLLLLPGTSPKDRDLGAEICHLDSILQPLILSATAMAQEKQQRFFSDIPVNLPAIKVNSPALREVLSNIIDNALKYTPMGGTIWVKAGRDLGDWGLKHPGYVEIAIADNGCGISPTDLGRIFERSYRGAQASTDIPGSGLGLAIAKELIEKMGGKIEVFSPPPPPSKIKKGTMFAIWLPIAEKS